MAENPPPPLWTLLRDLVLTTVVAVAIYVIFILFNRRVFGSSTTGAEVLLIEAGAIVLVAYLVARSFTSAANTVMTRRGQFEHRPTIRLFLNLVVAIGATLALFNLAGVSIQNIFLGSALAGVILGLAAQTVLSNVFAGLLLVIGNPFRPGEQVTVVSSNYGAIAPSYPHELLYPTYTGIVRDIQLLYTVLELGNGTEAKIPNSVLLTALIVRAPPMTIRSQRIRMTFPLTVTPGALESAVAAVAKELAPSSEPVPSPLVQVADIAPTTWDGVVTLWTLGIEEGRVRDRILRSVLPAIAPPKLP